MKFLLIALFVQMEPSPEYLHYTANSGYFYLADDPTIIRSCALQDFDRSRSSIDQINECLHRRLNIEIRLGGPCRSILNQYDPHLVNYALWADEDFRVDRGAFERISAALDACYVAHPEYAIPE